MYLIWYTVHGLEYGFGAHEYPTSGVFEVEPRSCPGFIFRRSVLLGTTDMSRSEFRSFMEHLSAKYHGDTYHLIAKNCNHFTDEVCMRLIGKPIPGWVNRLARLGKLRFLYRSTVFGYGCVLVFASCIKPSYNCSTLWLFIIKHFNNVCHGFIICLFQTLGRYFLAISVTNFTVA